MLKEHHPLSGPIPKQDKLPGPSPLLLQFKQMEKKKKKAMGTLFGGQASEQAVYRALPLLLSFLLTS